MKPSIVKVTIDNGAGQVREIYLREDQSLDALVTLMDRVAVNKNAWLEQQSRREYERYQRHQREYFFTSSGYANQNPFSSFFQENYGQHYPGQPKEETGRKKHKIKLAQMAGVEWDEADNMELKKLLRKAQQKCHPDTGGSHEAWLNLQKLQEQMGL